MKRWRQYGSFSLVLAVVTATLFSTGALSLVTAPAGATPSDIALTFDTSATECTGTTIYLPLYSANGVSLNATIDFGDGSSDEVDTTSGVASYTYASPGTYLVTITGTVPQFGTADPAINSADCSLTAVTNWDGVGLTSLDNAFDGDTNLVSVPTDLPTTVTDLANTFLGASSFDQDLESWDTASVVTMHAMFSGDTFFNNGGSPLATTAGGWNTAQVTDTSDMFESSGFDQNVESWDTSHVNTMASMFEDDAPFNNDGTPLSTILDGWNTAAVTTMDSMFKGDLSFNQDVESWDTAAVESMDAMFDNDIDFDNDGDPLATTTGGWSTAAVTTMDSMFYNDYALDLDVDSWNTASVTDMGFMFFDDDIFDNGESPMDSEPGGWSTAAVTSMDSMFTFDLDFNQDLSTWNTANVASMYRLFFKAADLNQDLGDWNLASATNLDSMLDDTALSTGNYDATLVGWAGESVHSGLTLGASDLVYDAAGASARGTLTSPPDDWTIEYDSEAPLPTGSSASPQPQAALAVTADSSSTYGQSVPLSTSGGSGAGAVSFTVTGGTASGCAIVANALSSTSAGTCVVTATKAADSTYAASTSAPFAITFDAAPLLTGLPRRLTLGFADGSHALGARARRAVIALSRRLTSSEVVTVTAYARHDGSLARRRATTVAGLLAGSPAHVNIVINTRLTSNKCVVVARA